MKLLYAVSEIAPWVKTGGLGDVAGALPQALARAGCDVRVLVPAWPGLTTAFPDGEDIAHLVWLGDNLPDATVREVVTGNGLRLWLLDCPALYGGAGGPYQQPSGADWPDNLQRFALLSKAAAVFASSVSPVAWRPDVLHCNDWQSALAPAYLRFTLTPVAPTVITVHNLAYQGLFPATDLPLAALPASAWGIEGVEFHGHFSFLKAGLQLADAITTVSPGYAREIQTPEFGCGMDGVLRWRADRLSGILNGIDTEQWDPARDAFLPANFDADRIKGKAECKATLQTQLGLAVDARTPLAGMVSRFAHQKGQDIVLDAADELLGRGLQLAVLGSGDAALQSAYAALAAEHPGRVAVRIGFDEAAAHLIEAGADLFLMPSRFEPCGLNQMYSLRYGTAPIVNPVGGLADTVVDAGDANLALGAANGFHMPAPDAAGLLAATDRALALWRQPTRWARLQRAGMLGDYGWSAPAREYVALYRNLTHES